LIASESQWRNFNVRSRKHGPPTTKRICPDCCDLAPIFSCEPARAIDPVESKPIKAYSCAHSASRISGNCHDCIKHCARCLFRPRALGDGGPSKPLHGGDRAVGASNKPARKQIRCRADGAPIRRRAARPSADAGIGAARRGGINRGSSMQKARPRNAWTSLPLPSSDSNEVARLSRSEVRDLTSGLRTRVAWRCVAGRLTFHPVRF
jgi:hypothetical protein